VIIRQGVFKMSAPFQLPFVAIVLAMLGVFATGIYLSCRSEGVYQNDNLREALLWGGGFIIYAIFDYFILMR
jgi:uncharacterized membrane protein YphA (DoxX/SURF4 family)